MLAKPKEAASPAFVLTKATFKAAEKLGLTNSDLAAVIGISEASVSRSKADGRTIQPESKEGQLALMLIRVFRSLDPLSGNEDQMQMWMTSYNKALVGVPKELIKKPDGLTRTLAYLDGMRAPT